MTVRESLKYQRKALVSGDPHKSWVTTSRNNGDLQVRTLNRKTWSDQKYDKFKCRTKHSRINRISERKVSFDQTSFSPRFEKKPDFFLEFRNKFIKSYSHRTSNQIWVPNEKRQLSQQLHLIHFVWPKQGLVDSGDRTQERPVSSR